VRGERLVFLIETQTAVGILSLLTSHPSFSCSILQQPQLFITKH